MEIWGLKNTISKVKNLLDTFNSLFKMTEERVGDDKVEKQREKRLKMMRRDSEIYGAIWRGLTHV